MFLTIVLSQFIESISPIGTPTMMRKASTQNWSISEYAPESVRHQKLIENQLNNWATRGDDFDWSFEVTKISRGSSDLRRWNNRTSPLPLVHFFKFSTANSAKRPFGKSFLSNPCGSRPWPYSSISCTADLLPWDFFLRLALYQGGSAIWSGIVSRGREGVVAVRRKHDNLGTDFDAVFHQ
jgi:hypothetical protein